MKPYPLWKRALIIATIVLAAIIAAPNLSSELPAIQLKAINSSATKIAEQGQTIASALNSAKIAYNKIITSPQQLLIRFDDKKAQAQAKQLFASDNYAKTYYSALTTAPNTPDWLQSLGLKPVVKGLDLRGGVYLLLQVDTSFLTDRLGQNNILEIRSALTAANIAFETLDIVDNGSVDIILSNASDMTTLKNLLYKKLPDLRRDQSSDNPKRLTATVTEATLNRLKAKAVDANILTLRSRMNSIGVAEPSITRQGNDRIVVQLPGLSDPNEAITLLRSTASLEYHMVDEAATLSKKPRFGVKFLPNKQDGGRIAIKRKIIVSGENIIDASSGKNARGENAVNVVLDEAGAVKMGANTAKNKGKRMAAVYIEYKPVTTRDKDGKADTQLVKEEYVISVATINGLFSKRFETTGKFTPQQARDLARKLRSGALAAPVYVIEQRTIGPSAGEQNIKKGTEAIILGFILVVCFMLFYYRKFGIVAVSALFLNVVFILAILSYIGATLTLPGIAGVVLTMGMAVDANVLIYERIREELRSKKAPEEAIRAGFDNAFSTIMDANITTLIAAIILFSFGTGPIKGFAVTLCIGIATSMYTAIIISRFIIHYWIEKRAVKTGNLTV